MRIALEPATALLPAGARRRPTLTFEILITVAWAALIYAVLPTGDGPRSTSSPAGAMPGMAGTGTAAPTLTLHAAVTALSIWVAMSIAMMLPGALSALDYVALRSYRWRRQRAMATFTLVYLTLWTAFGATAMTAATVIGAPPAIGVAVVLAAGAAWQVTSAKRRALRDCHRCVPIRARGWPATVSVAGFGAVNGWACIRSCWPAMLAMAIVPSEQMLLVMMFLTATMTAERLAPHPRRTTTAVALLLAVGALVALAAA